MGSGRFLPLFMVFCSGLCFSTQNIIVKLFMRKIGIFTLMLCRGSVQLCVTSVMVLYLRFVDRDQSPVFGDNTFTRVVLASRASLGFLGMLFSFLAIEILPIGDATTIIMLSPLLASFLGIFVLGESWHGMEILGTLVSLAGVAFVSHPMCIWGGINSKCADAYGLIYALLAALFSALAFLAVRLLGTSAKLNWIYVAFAQSLGICLLAISSSLIFGESIELEFDLLVDASILCAGLIGSCGQLMMTFGLQREKSAMATAMRSSDILLGLGFQATFTGDRLDLLSIGGASLVLMGILIIVFKKHRDGIEETVVKMPIEYLDQSAPSIDPHKRIAYSPVVRVDDEAT